MKNVETQQCCVFTSVEHSQELQLTDIARIYSYNPARNFGIAKRGLIQEGFFADLAVIDMSKKRKVQPNKHLSRCSWSPFEGYEFTGDVIMTFLNGQLVYENEHFHLDKALESAHPINFSD